MLKRKAYDKLLIWKNSSRGKTAILINGARRVGKSYLCQQFAEKEYRSYIFIDFANISPEIRDLIENESYDLNLFFMKLSVFYNTQLFERNSVIIFDEIQLFPRARQLIKYLVSDGRYDYIETGSLLSIKQNVQDIVIPSEEKMMELHPLDFEEFLWALEDTSTFPLLEKMFKDNTLLGASLHRKILNLFRQYMLVGGMPQAVVEYVESKDFAKVDEIKRDILSLYRNDIAKFAGHNQYKVLSIFDEIPSQLSKAEKKYKLSAISKDARLREYEEAFMWLEDAMITNTCFNTNDPNVGLGLSSDFSTRKCYMADTGLLVSLAFYENSFMDNDLYKAILFGKLNINEGMLMENVVAQSLRTNGHKLYFYSRNDRKQKENHMEIDFLLSKNKKIIPIEVKSSVYRKHTSLDRFSSKFSNRVARPIILYQKDILLKNEVLHLPVYMAALL